MQDESERTWITAAEGSAPPPWKSVEGGAAFPNTRWTLVGELRKCDGSESAALETLCRNYWYPLYSYLRRKGKPSHDAQDFTQGFFEYLLAGNYLARAEKEKGRLRSYLLGALKHYSSGIHRKEIAAKRGGGVPRISIDEEQAENRYQNEPRVDEAEHPDRLFERRWALTLLETVLGGLEREHRAQGKERQFEVLSPFLAWNSGSMTYSKAGAELEMSEGAVKVAVHRMRKRYRELLHQEILATVASPEEVEEEIQYLLRVIG